MLRKFLHSTYALPIAVLLVVIIMINFDTIRDGLIGFYANHFESKKPPLLKLDGQAVDVAAYQYLGAWRLQDGIVKTGNNNVKGARPWRDVVHLTYDNDRKVFQIGTSAPKLSSAITRQLTPENEDGVFKRIAWRANQVSVFAFRALSSRKQVAVVAIDTDNTIALYVNGKFIREVSANAAVELGANLLIPVALESGENLVTMKVLSNEGPPRLRMGLILDQSKDFQAAWNKSWGFLSKLICDKTGDTFEPPVVKWDALLNRMTIGAGVYDVLNGKNLFQVDAVRSGNLIRDGGKVLGEGIYKITYKSLQPDQETFEEFFLVGVPRNTLITLRRTISELPWSDSEKLNVKAQLTRAGILFRKGNYQPGDRIWEEKMLYTLGNLAEFVNLKKVAQAAKPARDSNTANAGNDIRAGSAACATDIFKGMTGLRLRGYISKIDNSEQFYRLYVPLHHKAGEKLPLLLIMPTTMSLDPNVKPFLAGPYIASHREAVRVCEYAEKYGFAVLWPGYRSPPMWWTYESVHAEEAIEDVEKNHDVDGSKVSVYGTCAGGFLAARLATTYPNRFAAIVYDRAIFERDPVTFGGSDDSTYDWIRAINPSGKIIANPNIKIIVLNDGTRGPGHGPIPLSREFLRRAQAKRDDIIYAIGQRKIGVGLWNTIFGHLADCKNEQYDAVKADIPAASGYAGPISEVFGTPFIVVQGTRAKPEEAGFMEVAIKNLKEQYQGQFYGVDFVLKKDTEITDEEIEKYSLVLIGNAQSNTVWGKLAARYPENLTPYTPTDDWPASGTESAFAEVIKSPVNKGIYLLLIGADKLENMPLLGAFNPFTASNDSYVLKYRDGHEREYVTPHREIPSSKISNSK